MAPTGKARECVPLLITHMVTESKVVGILPDGAVFQAPVPGPQDQNTPSSGTPRLKGLR